MNNFRVTKVLLIIVIVLGGLYLLIPEYLRNVIIYQYADIDDYRIFTNRTVIAGPYQPWMESPESKGNELTEDALTLMEDYQTLSFLVIKDKEIIFERYWEEFSPETLSSSFSMSKSIVSLLIGIAIDQGRIQSVDQPVGDFIPVFTEGDLAGISIRHLLEMSSGLKHNEKFMNPFSWEAKAYYGSELSEITLKQESATGPGKVFEYNSMNTQLLAMILEKATGRSVSAFTSEHLWKPLGAGRDALWSLDKVNGVEKAFCCFNSNARDFARFGQLILNRGSWNDEHLLSEEYLKNALSPALHLTDNNGGKVDYYGWQWWINDYRGLIVYSMRGLKGQYVFAIPEKDLVIVRLGNKSGKVSEDGANTEDMFNWLEIGLQLSE